MDTDNNVVMGEVGSGGDNRGLEEGTSVIVSTLKTNIKIKFEMINYEMTN